MTACTECGVRLTHRHRCRTCSAACAEARRLRLAEEAIEAPSGCVVCGGEISKRRGPDAVTCSRICRIALARMNADALSHPTAPDVTPEHRTFATMRLPHQRTGYVYR